MHDTENIYELLIDQFISDLTNLESTLTTINEQETQFFQTTIASYKRLLVDLQELKHKQTVPNTKIYLAHDYNGVVAVEPSFAETVTIEPDHIEIWHMSGTRLNTAYRKPNGSYAWQWKEDQEPGYENETGI